MKRLLISISLLEIIELDVGQKKKTIEIRVNTYELGRWHKQLM